MKPIFLIGYMGAGKTTLARQLSALYGIPYIDLDQEIEKIIGISISDYFISSGESNFRMLEHQTLLHVDKILLFLPVAVLHVFLIIWIL